MTREHRRERDIVGGIIAAILFLLLAGVAAAQYALARPSYRPRLSLVDALEGVPLEEAAKEHGWDLPSTLRLW